MSKDSLIKGSQAVMSSPTPHSLPSDYYSFWSYCADIYMTIFMFLTQKNTIKRIQCTDMHLTSICWVDKYQAYMRDAVFTTELTAAAHLLRQIFTKIALLQTVKN